MEKPFINRRQKWTLWAFAGILFLGLYLFFTRISPLYVFDMDDWLYLSNFRHPIPDSAEWNPIKVLPETWMPAIAYLSTYLVYPFTGDFIGSLTIAFACAASAMITGFVIAAVDALGRWYDTPGIFTKICCGGLLLLSFFLPFLAAGEPSAHLLHATDVTCVMNYIIPTMLNFILWMYFFDQDRQWKPMGIEAAGFLVLILYLAIFSSLFHSIILMSLFGMQLLFALIGGIRDNLRQRKPWISWAFIGDYLKIHWPKLLSLAVWLLSMVFQLGGREGEAAGGQMRLGKILLAFWELLGGLNPWFQVSVLVINLAALALAAYRWFHHRDSKFLLKWVQIFGCVLLTAVYIILVTGKLSAFYFLRTDVVIAWMGLVIFMTVFSLAYLVQIQPKAAVMLPVLLCCLISMTVFHQGGYLPYNVPRLPETVIRAMDDDIMDQIITAHDQGLTEVSVYIPESLTDKSWPLDAENTSVRISEALFRHGITERKMAITIIPTPEKDLEYGLK